MKFLLVIAIIYGIYRFSQLRKPLNPPSEPWQEAEEEGDFIEIDPK